METDPEKRLGAALFWIAGAAYVALQIFWPERFVGL